MPAGFDQVNLILFMNRIIVKLVHNIGRRCRCSCPHGDTLSASHVSRNKIAGHVGIQVCDMLKSFVCSTIAPFQRALCIKPDIVAGIKTSICFTHYFYGDFGEIVAAWC